ncbi:MAG: M3 family oligoendopeptidase [Candidatus Eisenbacteria bacterium]|nr:M3 family oligoendopeptidase [Candidatus Eisenbacteria bacterium]
MGTYPINWNLDSLYEGGSGSADFARLLDQCDRALDGYEKVLAALPERPGGEWARAALELQKIARDVWEAIAFIECLQARNVEDGRADLLMARAEAMNARQRSYRTRLGTLLLSAGDEEWRAFLAREELIAIAFPLEEQREVMRLKMDTNREVLAEELAVDGYHGWSRLYEKMAGSLRAEWTEGGETSRISMGQLHNKMENPDRETRRLAFEKLEEAWRSVAHPTAMALNNQAGFRLGLYKHRGWDSALDEPLRINRIRRETLDAMWGVVADESRRLLPFMERKCRLLGIDRMKWYDQNAPIGGSGRGYTYDEGAAFILEHFGGFSPDLRDFAAMVFEKGWIESEDRPGKRAGGFCTDFPIHRETRIFTTFGGTYGGVSTIGHELGHAYHTWLIRELPFWTTQYPMTLAETASTFCETLLLDAALETAESDAERLTLLAQKAEEAVTMMMNLRARFLFESAFFEARAKGALGPEELDEMMTRAQKEAYCDGLDPEGYHPLFWASKLHFYITSMPFYNFPYVFGYLFSNGIYARATAEGPAFAKRYENLLKDTGRMTCEDAARKHLGVDLARPEFWKSAVDIVLDGVERFNELADKS